MKALYKNKTQMKLEIFLSHNIVKNHDKHIEFCIMSGPETGNTGLSESLFKKSSRKLKTECPF